VSREAVLASLIDGLYESALDAQRWPAFLEELARALNGTLPMLFLHDTQTHTGSAPVSVGYDAGILSAYQSHLAECNVWLRGAAQLLVPGRVRASHMMCSRSTLRRSQWYADSCLPLGISQAIGATIFKDATMTANIAVLAGPARAPFGNDEFALIQELMPHLRRATRVHLHVAQADLRHRELREAMENLTVGVIWVSANARIVNMNGAARKIINARDGLISARAGLGAQCARETNKLRAMIGAAAQTSAKAGRSAGGALQISRSAGRSALDVVVSPLATGETWCFADRAVAAVYISDPAQNDTISERSLVRRHRLTRAEAKVAALIAGGASGRKVAQRLDVSYNTVKTHLKHIYGKTNTRGQGELIRLVMRSKPPLNVESLDRAG
jgi:DNA-binding CsgD family transcriptional regulator/PAS domain-containing protein